MNIIDSPRKSKIDLHLRQKLDAVLITRQGSRERAKAMSKLIRIVQNLPGIKKVAHQDYELVLNQTWEWMNRDIDKFQISDSDSSLENDLVRWINGYLKWRIHDLYLLEKNRNVPLLCLESAFDQGINHYYIQQLDQHIEHDCIQQQEHKIIVAKIESWIMLDPEEKLKSCFLKSHSHCNCQDLAYRLLIKSPPDKLANISRETGVSYQTLISHWKRNCLCILREQSVLFGYEHE